jgi:undecaprenyl-diphosphatase
VGAGLVLASRAEAKHAQLPAYEEAVFRAVNGASDRIRVPVRAVMQAGTFGTVPAVSVLALLVGRTRLAASLAVGGTIAWVGAKLAKPFGGRERPRGVLQEVTIRERIEGDLGWVSGHTAVATTLSFVASQELPRAVRPVLIGIVGTVGFGRMYVGAHLPHDIVGGAGLGMMISAVIPPADGG